MLLHLPQVLSRTCYARYLVFFAALLVLLLTHTATWAQNPNWQAALTSANSVSGAITSRNMAADGNGNVYVVGYFTGTVRLGTTTLSNQVPGSPSRGKELFVAKWASATNEWVWAVQGGGTSDDQATSVAVQGNSVFVAGYLAAVNARFGDVPLGDNKGGLTLFVLKLTDAGSTATAVWGQTTTTTSNYGIDLFPTPTALAVSDNSVYVAGQFSGPTIAFGSTTLRNAGGTSSSNDAFVAKIADTGARGAWQWAQRAGGTNHDQATGVAVRGSRVYLSGYFSGTTADFGTTTLTNEGNSSTADIFVARLTDSGTDGTFDWAQGAGGTGGEQATTLAVSGNIVYLAGNVTSGTVHFAPLSLTPAPGDGGRNLFVAKLTDEGPAPAFNWVERAGGAAFSNLTALAVRGSQLYVTGDFYSASPMKFGSITVANPGTLYDVFVARLDDLGTAGVYQWAHKLGGPETDHAAGLAVDAGGVYVGGAMHASEVLFDGAPDLTLYTGGVDNCVLGQLSAAGTWQQTQQGFVGGGFAASDFAVDNCGFVYVVGSLTGQAQLGSTTLASRGSLDLVVAKWNPVSNTWIWAVRTGGTGGELATGIAVNNKGQVYITGSFSNADSGPPATVAFGNTIITHTSANNNDTFIAKLEETANSASFSWACPVASNGEELFNDVVASGNSVYVAGYFESQSLLVGTTQLLHANGGGGDIMLGKLIDLGATYRVEWAMSAGGYYDDQAASLALNGKRLYVVGRYTSAIRAGTDAFVARLTDTGAPKAFDWLLHAPGDVSEVATSVAVSNYKVYITGYFFSTSIKLGNTELYNSTPNNNQTSDGFVAGLVDNGASASFAWARQVSGTKLSGEYCTSVATDGKYVFVSGKYSGNPASFGYGLTLPTFGTFDGFVARLTEVGATTSFDWVQHVYSGTASEVNGLVLKGNKLYASGRTSGISGATLGNITLNGSGPFLATLTDSDVSGYLASFTYGSATYCRTAGTILPALNGALNGTFTATPAGLVLDPTTGAINLAASTSGTYTLRYALDGPCNNTPTQVLTVVNGASAAFTYPAGTRCAGSTATLAPTLGADASAGRFTAPSGLAINATTGEISLSGSVAGTYTVTNTLAAANGCAAATSTATVTISPAISAAFRYSASTFCQTAGGAVPTVTGTAGGRFSAEAGLALDAATGLVSPAASTPGTYTVTYSVAGACASSSTQPLVITAPPVATFAYGASAYCLNEATNPLPVPASGALLGTFSSTAGLLLNATTGLINLAGSKPGTYTITNTVGASGGCAAVVSTTTLTLSAPAVATFAYPGGGSYCQGSAAVLPAISGTAGGRFTVSPATGLVLDSETGVLTLLGSSPGRYSVSYTVGTTCPATSSQLITVSELPSAPTLTLSGTAATGLSLTASPSTGCQFYRNGVLVPGTTGATLLLTPGTGNGTYTATATSASGCNSPPSAPVVVAVPLSTTASAAPTKPQLYPNPTLGQTWLVVPPAQATPELWVYDALGQVVQHRLLPTTLTPIELNLSHLPPGVYLVRVGTWSQRLVRQ
jgi:hypothetical protein